MLPFEEINRMIAAKAESPDDLALAEESAWNGLQAIYDMYRLGTRSREECTAMKRRLKERYEREASRFDAMNEEMMQALALLYMVRGAAA